MLQKGSRYEKSSRFTPLPDGTVVFEGIRTRSINRATGVVEHTVIAGDRLDLLARHYYNDERLWWRIADANPEFLYGGDMVLEDKEGHVILVPKAEE
jgi:nucleoid-associated protein YgaU